MHKRCVICGIELDETVAVCPKCGTRNSESPAEPVSTVASETPTGPSRCVICGIVLDETTSICPKCGTKQPTEAPVLPYCSPQTDTPAEPEAPKVIPAPAEPTRTEKKAKPLLLILGGVALVLVAVIALMVSFFGSTPDPMPDAPTDPPSAFSTLLDGQLALMSGNPENLERLAPAEYWEYCAYRNSCTKEEYLINIKAHHIIYYELNHPKRDTTYTGEILFEDTMSTQMLQKVTDTLFVQYGILEKSVIDGRELNIQVKKVTDGDTTALPIQTVYAVEIDGTWYLITYTELNGENIVTFFLR